MGYGYKARRRNTVHDARRRQVNLGSIPPELKYLDCHATNSTVAQPAGGSLAGGELQPASGATNCLSAPAQGDGQTQRDGKHIIVRSVQFHAKVRWPAQDDVAGAISATNEPVFLALVWDNQTNASAINSEDVYMLPDDAVSPQLCALPLRNPNFGDRYKVIKSWVIYPRMGHSMTPDNTTTAPFTHCIDATYNSVTYYTRCHVPINFNSGTTADVANVVDKSLHVMAFSAASGSAAADVTYVSRIRFIG